METVSVSFGGPDRRSPLVGNLIEGALSYSRVVVLGALAAGCPIDSGEKNDGCVEIICADDTDPAEVESCDLSPLINRFVHSDPISVRAHDDPSVQLKNNFVAEISNSGSEPCGPFEVIFTINGVESVTKRVDGLEPGSTTAFWAPLPTLNSGELAAYALEDRANRDSQWIWTIDWEWGMQVNSLDGSDIDSNNNFDHYPGQTWGHDPLDETVWVERIPSTCVPMTYLLESLLEDIDPVGTHTPFIEQFADIHETNPYFEVTLSARNLGWVTGEPDVLDVAGDDIFTEFRLFGIGGGNGNVEEIILDQGCVSLEKASDIIVTAYDLTPATEPGACVNNLNPNVTALANMGLVPCLVPTLDPQGLSVEELRAVTTAL